MRELCVGSVDLCVDDFGDESNPLVLMVAGAACSYDLWDVGLCEAIAAGGRHVVRYDHRDTGRSTTGRPGEPDYDGTALTDDCAALVEVLGAPAHLVGLSMGGGIAQSVTLTRPELVSSLTLISTAAAGGVDDDSLPGPTPELAASFEHPPPDPDWSDRRAAVAWMVEAERLFCGPGFDEPIIRARAESAYDRSIDPAAAGNHWLTLDEGEAPALDVHDVAVPTLVVHGDADPLFPLPHAEALAAAVPGARLLVLSDTGHQVPRPVDWPALVAAHLGLGD